MKTAERLFKALANGRRLVMLLYFCRAGKTTIADVADAPHLSYKTAAWNIRKLLLADLLEFDRLGVVVYYRLAPVVRQQPHLRAMLNFVRNSATKK